jgi:hypothetical protein
MIKVNYAARLQCADGSSAAAESRLNAALVEYIDAMMRRPPDV